MSKGRITATIIGMAELVNKLRSLQGQADDRMVTAMQAGGLVLQNAWKQNIVAMGAVDTGTYLRSIHMEVTDRRQGNVEITVGSDITDPPYPEYVEYGTSRMIARPAARKAIDVNEGRISNEVIDTLRELFAPYGNV